jgi:hypothetical protein
VEHLGSPSTNRQCDLVDGCLQANILETEVTTATRVAEFMFDQGLAQAVRPADVRGWIEGQLYKPQY